MSFDAESQQEKIVKPSKFRDLNFFLEIHHNFFDTFGVVFGLKSNFCFKASRLIRILKRLHVRATCLFYLDCLYHLSYYR